MLTDARTGEKRRCRKHGHIAKWHTPSMGNTMIRTRMVGLRAVTVSPSVDSGVVQHGLSESTSVGGNSSGDISVTWSSPFSNTNYTVVCSVQGPNSNINEPQWYIKTKTATSVTVRLINEALTAQDFTVHAMGIAD